MLPARIAHYEVLEKLGEGGMGVVYKARDTHLGRYVAIKVLPAARMTDPERRLRFTQEAKAASALNHPNIITVHDIARGGEVDFIVMEYVAGKTLDRLIPRKGMATGEGLNLAVQIADALAAAHEAGIVHRDLKPGNVMVTPKGQVKVLDFGLAKLVESEGVHEESTLSIRPETEEGAILGTVAYMSPEQAEGKPVDTRSDIFSFGQLLYEMLTGRRAFQGETKLATLAAIIQREPSPLPEEVPRDLAKLIRRCLRKQPERRFQTIVDLKLELEELKEESESGVLATAPVPAGQTGRRLSRTARAAIVGVIGLAAAAWVWLRPPGPEVPLTATPLTSYPGWELSPSFSPDGLQVAFAWHREDQSDIYIKQIGVEEPFQLTATPEAESRPAWSPDGGYIAFLRWLPAGRFALVVVPQRGGTERVLAEFHPTRTGLFHGPAWTPDSAALVVAGGEDREGTAGLFLVSVRTGEKHRLTQPPAETLEDIAPAVSPDGRTLAFIRYAEGVVAHDIYLLPLGPDTTAQGDPVKLAAASPDWRLRALGLSWLPGGRELLVVDGSGLRRMFSSNSAQVRQVTLPGRLGGEVAVSPRGDRLAYGSIHADANIWRLDMSPPDRRSWKTERWIASTQYEGEPDYSPDGKRIAFASSRSGAPEIFVCDADGTRPTQLTSFGGPFTHRPRWSPDGEQVVFYSDASGNRDVYVISGRGGAVRQITTHPARDTNPEWSRDGRWIYFQSDRGGSTQTWKVPASGGEAAPVPDARDVAIESLDGEHLYYARGFPDQYSVWRAPMSGGESVQVIDGMLPAGGWRVTGEGIYYIASGTDGRPPSIRLLNFATGVVETLATPRGGVHFGLAVAPDRRSLLYVQYDEGGSDLMLVENFR